MKYVLYGNGSSGNHGCEAIVRGTHQLLDEDLLILSENKKEDLKYGLGDISEVRDAITGERLLTPFFQAYIKRKITGNYSDLDGVAYVPSIKKASKEAEIALSVGGDNYCYGNTGLYAYLNRQCRNTGMKTVLWGCSINPEVLEDKAVREDLCRYDLIVARESITYTSLRQVTDHVILAPDPAFFMKPSETQIPEMFRSHAVVGINISPMIISFEKGSGSAYNNYKELIKFIIKETDSGIALIPHVVWQTNDDRIVLDSLFEEFRDSERIIMIDDRPAPALKSIISKCTCFVGARTHATIAAYSTCVPTLSVGYSVKARGIARDLFGSEKGFSVPVDELYSQDVLKSAFEKIYMSRDRIRLQLKNKKTQYLCSGPSAVKELKKLEQ